MALKSGLLSSFNFTTATIAQSSQSTATVGVTVSASTKTNKKTGVASRPTTTIGINTAVAKSFGILVGDKVNVLIDGNKVAVVKDASGRSVVNRTIKGHSVVIRAGNIHTVAAAKKEVDYEGDLKKKTIVFEL